MIWDVVQPKDEWERKYAHLEFVRHGLYLIRAKRIQVRYE